MPPVLEAHLTGHFTSYKHRTNHELATPAAQDSRVEQGLLQDDGLGGPFDAGFGNRQEQVGRSAVSQIIAS